MSFCPQSLAIFPLEQRLLQSHLDLPATQKGPWLQESCLQGPGDFLAISLLPTQEEKSQSISGTFCSTPSGGTAPAFQSKMKRPSSGKNLGSTEGKCPDKRIIRPWCILPRESVESHYLVILMNKMQRFLQDNWCEMLPRRQGMNESTLTHPFRPLNSVMCALYYLAEIIN